jgi:GMP synthase (glutamine-hydrolysing)
MAKILVIQHNDDDNLNDLAAPFLEAGLEIVQWHAEKTPAPVSSLEGFSGLVSLGAFAGVEDEAATSWMPFERSLIESALAAEMPVLGLCFGSQLLASVAGAEVGKSGSPEVGWYEVEMTEAAAEDPLMSVLGPQPEVIQYHYDTFNWPASSSSSSFSTSSFSSSTSSAPDSRASSAADSSAQFQVTILGRSNGMNQAFRVGKNAWGTQFHIELNLPTMLGWIASYPRAFEKAGNVPAEQVELTRQNWRLHQQRSVAFGRAFAEQVLEFTK